MYVYINLISPSLPFSSFNSFICGCNYLYNFRSFARLLALSSYTSIICSFVRFFICSFVQISLRADDCHQRIFNIVINLAAINFRFFFIFCCCKNGKYIPSEQHPFFQPNRAGNIETAHFNRRIRIKSNEERRFLAFSLLGSTFCCNIKRQENYACFLYKNKHFSYNMCVRVFVCVHKCVGRQYGLTATSFYSHPLNQ